MVIRFEYYRRQGIWVCMKLVNCINCLVNQPIEDQICILDQL